MCSDSKIYIAGPSLVPLRSFKAAHDFRNTLSDGENSVLLENAYWD